MKLAVKGVIVAALVDCGASRSLLRLDVYKHIMRSTHSNMLLKPSPPLKSITGHKLNIIGETEIVIANAGAVTVLVTTDIPHELVMITT